jgi:hypothetical protein
MRCNYVLRREFVKANGWLIGGQPWRELVHRLICLTDEQVVKEIRPTLDLVCYRKAAGHSLALLGRSRYRHINLENKLSKALRHKRWADDL